MNDFIFLPFPSIVLRRNENFEASVPICLFSKVYVPGPGVFPRRDILEERSKGSLRDFLVVPLLHSGAGLTGYIGFLSLKQVLVSYAPGSGDSNITSIFR
jgi:hypothetical protein